MKRALAILVVSMFVLGLLASGISCTKTVYITVTPTPTPALSPTPSPTPTPTLVPTPTPSPSPSPTPTPTPTPIPTPTRTPTPTPTPTPTLSLGYSRSNPVGIDSPLSIKVGRTGISGSYDYYMVRITLVNYLRGDQAWSLFQAANMFNDPPKAGYEYILAKVRFEYLTGPTPDTAYDVSTVLFYAVSSSGKDYDGVWGVVPDPSINTSLYPAASHEGWIAFLIAQDDSGPLMTFGRKYDGTGGIWFKLY